MFNFQLKIGIDPKHGFMKAKMMSNLWVLQTNSQKNLDDCRKYKVYGVREIRYKNLPQLQVGDKILLRLKLDSPHTEYRYLGPYLATSENATWIQNIVEERYCWKKITGKGPNWIRQFPWCIFLKPASDFIDELRTLESTQEIKACELITPPRSDIILNNLIQSDFLPDSRTSVYRTIRGVWVRSRGEYMIDNWFAEKGVVTYYEKAIYLDAQRIVPDWYIPRLETYVEFLGLKGKPAYDRDWGKKKQAYKKHNIKFIELDDNDLIDLDRSIPKKLPRLLG